MLLSVSASVLFTTISLVQALQETDAQIKSQKISTLLQDIDRKLELAKLPPYYHTIKVSFKKDQDYIKALDDLNLYMKDNPNCIYQSSDQGLCILLKVKRSLPDKDPTYLYLYQVLGKYKIEYGVLF